MKVSEVKVVLTEQDILSIIDEYIDIEGLTIEDIQIKEFINIKGNYKKKIIIPFEVKIGLGSICGNIINIKVFNVNVSKIGIFSGIRNIALKKIFSEFQEYGVKVDKDIVTVDLNLASKLIPYFYFKLNNINIISGALEVQANNVVYSEKKPIVSIKKNCALSPTVSIVSSMKRNCILSPSIQQDGYSKVRDKVVHKVPDKYEKVIQYGMIVPDIVVMLWRLLRDKRVNIKVKMMVAGIIAYLASPIDILPDFIPLVGKVDDVAIAFFGLNAIINEVPEEIILQSWQGEENIILLTKEVVGYISKIVGSQNVGMLLSFIKKAFKKCEKE